MGVRQTQAELEAKFSNDLLAARNALDALAKDAAWLLSRTQDVQDTFAGYVPALSAGAKLARVSRAQDTVPTADNFWATAEDIIGPY